MKIDGSVALVTGGASGLGLATAELLASKGATVVVVDLPGSAGEEVAGRLGGRFAAADVTSEDEVNRALDVAAELGQLRITVNCAGIGSGGRVAGKEGPYPLDQFRRVLEVNLVGTFNVLSKAAFRIGAAEPVEGERGVIVNTSSIAAFEGQIGQAAYTASKAAIHGLTIQTARDLASLQIRVCTIAPGLMDTPLLAGLRDDIREQLALGAKPASPGTAGGVRAARRAHHREPLPQRGDDPTRRRTPDGAALMPWPVQAELPLDIKRARPLGTLSPSLRKWLG